MDERANKFHSPPQNRQSTQADMSQYFDAIKKNALTNEQGASLLFFDTKVIYDSGYMDIITTFTPNPLEPKINHQIQQRVMYPFTEDIGEIIGKHHNIIIQHFNNQHRPI